MGNDPNAIPRSAVLMSMQFERTKCLLKAIIEWLESGAADEGEWDAYIDFTDVCLSEMSKMTEAIPDSMRESGKRLNRTILHVRVLLLAMRRRDRVTALESGRTAFGAL